MKRRRVNVARLASNLVDPSGSACYRRSVLLVEVLRDWAEPMTAAEIRELLDWPVWTLQQVLEMVLADGRVGTVGRGTWKRYIADPDITGSLVPARERVAQ